mmetsp:Transcript_853/g.5323  ORF Transcript_853/g.5323 Transcript_853/m.5323 type:complete len:388 (+) Transcript_853:3173-4336(+)
MDHQHVDAIRLDFGSQGSAERGEEALGRRVEHGEGTGHGSRRRRREHHASLQLLLLHLADEVVRDLHGTDRVAFQVFHLLFHGRLEEESSQHVSGVVEHELHVDVFRRASYVWHVSWSSQMDPDFAKAALWKPSHQFVVGVLKQRIVQRHEHDVDALFCQSDGHRFSDAAGRSGHERPLGLVLLLQVLLLARPRQVRVMEQIRPPRQDQRCARGSDGEPTAQAHGRSVELRLPSFLPSFRVRLAFDPSFASPRARVLRWFAQLAATSACRRPRKMNVDETEGDASSCVGGAGSSRPSARGTCERDARGRTKEGARAAGGRGRAAALRDRWGNEGGRRPPGPRRAPRAHRTCLGTAWDEPCKAGRDPGATVDRSSQASTRGPRDPHRR